VDWRNDNLDCKSILGYIFLYRNVPISEVFTIPHEFQQIPNRMSEFPWNSDGFQMAGASAILVSNSIEIPTESDGIQQKWSESGSLLEQFPLEFQRNALLTAIIII